MDVSKELRDELQEAIIIAMESHKLLAETSNGDEVADFDDFLTDAVVDVLLRIEPPAVKEPIKTMVAVQYIGHRAEYSDGLFNTGIWLKGQTKLVAAVVAGKMFGHPDVYVPSVEPVGAGVEQVEEPATGSTDAAAEKIQQARESVLAMTRKAAVQDFVAANYNGREIPAENAGKLDDMKAFAIQQIELYGMP